MVSQLPVPNMLQKGLAYQQSGDLDRAQGIYEEILRLRPGSFHALHLLGVIAARRQHLDRAIELINAAIAAHPHHQALHLAHNSLGLALQSLERWDAALESFDAAIRCREAYAEAHLNRGNLLVHLQRWHAAMQSYERAIEIQPGLAEAHANRGNVLRQLCRCEEALASYDVAIELKPDLASAHSNRGDLLRELHDLDAALASCNRAIALNPGGADAYVNRGNVLHQLNQSAAALASYDQAIERQSDCALAYVNRANVQIALKRYEEAIASLDVARGLRSEETSLQPLRLFAKIQICDWDGLEADIDRLCEHIARGETIANPLAMLALSDSGALHRQAVERWTQRWFPARDAAASSVRHGPHERIRIGYFSADFFNHPTSYLAAELFEKHDRSCFELTAFAFGPGPRDEMRERLEKGFDSFLDVRNRSDQDIVRLARSLQIDIAVDLKGYTEGARPNLFAMRAAPLQVSYLGFPGTMGASYIDYVVADRVLIPSGSRQDFTEKVIYLPHSYQVNDRKRRIDTQALARRDLGLPAEGFVFCCFNNNFKILPATFGVWMRILARVPGSILWLFEDNPTAAANLRREAARRGVDAARLVFAARVPLPQHLARHRVADLFLDTLPYNAHTTASDALWAGLPVLTCLGGTFAGRVAASLLEAIGLPELIVSTWREYEAKAVELASNPGGLDLIKEKLRSNRDQAPLFDSGLFTQHLERGYRRIYDSWQRGAVAEDVYL